MTGPIRVTAERMPQGYRGTRRTVEHMKALIKEGARDIHVRQTAIEILRGSKVRPRDYLGEIRALFEWVQRNVRYTRDPVRVELLHSARRLIEFRSGDCDDMAILLGAFLQAVGHPVRVVLSGPDPRRPCFFSHVYLEVLYHGIWIALDATVPNPMGWAARSPVREIHRIDVGPAGATRCESQLGDCGCGCGGRAGGCAAAGRHGVEAPADPEIRRSLDQGVDLLRRFGRKGATRIERVRHARVVPPVAVQLGSLVGLIYRSDRGPASKPRSYLHMLERPPRLVSNVQGTQLYVVGGGYCVTQRGIEG